LGVYIAIGSASHVKHVKHEDHEINEINENHNVASSIRAGSAGATACGLRLMSGSADRIESNYSGVKYKYNVIPIRVLRDSSKGGEYFRIC